MKNISLAEDTISKDEMDSLADWLKTYPRLTKGPLTEEFEEAWSQKLGVKHSVFVNSGSSANLLMLYTLIESGEIKVGDKVIVPAISWATDLAPVIQLGLVPILCDVDPENLGVCPKHLEEVVAEHNPKVLLLVSVLGLVPNMPLLKGICDNNNIILLEDVCESLGSKWSGKTLGTFGLMSSFSLYFGHHLSTIEGGMVCTNDTETYHLLKSIRSHGWGREYPEGERKALESKYNVGEFNSLFTFYNVGFNIRATDLQAFIGISQLKKWDCVCATRSNNFKTYLSALPDGIWKPTIDSRSYISNFAYPLITPNRDRIRERLTAEGIECRPLISGSMSKQPMYTKNYSNTNTYEVAEKIHREGMYLPNHQHLSEEDVIRICDIIKDEI